MSKSHNATGRSKYGPPHVRLYHWLLDSPAWLALTPNARATYVELCRRFVGNNNGRISLSVREAADRAGIGKDTASRALLELREAGFIKVTRKGHFHGETREATLWELTEYPVDGAAATKDFMRPKNHFSVASQGQTVSPEGRDGPTSRTERYQRKNFGT